MDGSIETELGEAFGSTDSFDPDPGITLADRYVLLPGQRIPSLDSPQAAAYAVRDLAESGADLYCLIAPVDVVPRLGTALPLAADPVEGLLAPRITGYCVWPPLGKAVAAFVLSRPPGARLSPGSASGFSSAELSRRILEPICRALSALDARGLTHRAIRADNLFWIDEEESEVVLGECVSAAAGADQPAVYEPLNRMTAMPVGRGAGGPGDDLYALGVTIIDLLYGLRGENGYPPALGFRKLEYGTLATLLPQASPAPEIAGLLRGLLSDDIECRWTSRHLSRWLAGERVEPPSPVAQVTAQRPMPLGKGRFRTARSLAYGLSRRPDRALSLLRDGTLDHWLRVSLRDVRLATGIARELKNAEKRPGSRASARDILLQRCCQVLDPEGPIRFGHLSLMPEACGTVLTRMLLRREDPAEIQALLRRLAAGDLLTTTLAGDTTHLDAAVKLLNAGGPGCGLPRCLYELNPDLPCLSPLLAIPAPDVRSLLKTLDSRAADLPEDSPLTDAHVAAFIGSRLGLQPLQLAAEVGGGSSASPETRKELRLLARAQAFFGPATLPGLARAAAVRIAPVIRSIHNRPDRKRLAAAVAACVEKGDLAKMMAHLDDGSIWARDRSGFAKAQREFSACSRELERLKDPSRSGLSEAIREGERVAAYVSLSITVMILCSLLAVS